MDNLETPQEILDLLPKQIQALFSDATFYFAGQKLIKISERKILIEKDIELIRENLTKIEMILNKT